MGAASAGLSAAKIAAGETAKAAGETAKAAGENILTASGGITREEVESELAALGEKVGSNINVLQNLVTEARKVRDRLDKLEMEAGPREAGPRGAGLSAHQLAADIRRTLSPQSAQAAPIEAAPIETQTKILLVNAMIDGTASPSWMVYLQKEITPGTLLQLNKIIIDEGIKERKITAGELNPDTAVIAKMDPGNNTIITDMAQVVGKMKLQLYKDQAAAEDAGAIAGAIAGAVAP
jgi:hypothetical protein